MQPNLDWLLSDDCAKGGVAIQKIKSYQKFAVLTAMYGLECYSSRMSQTVCRAILLHEKNTRDQRLHSTHSPAVFGT